MAGPYESLLNQAEPSYGGVLNQRQPSYAGVLNSRTQMLDQTANGQPVDPKAVEQADQESTTVLRELSNGLRRFGFSTIATTQAFTGAMVAPFAPEAGQHMIDEGLRTVGSMPASINPAVQNWADVHDFRSGALKFAGAVGEGLPSSALTVGGILAGRGLGRGLGYLGGLRGEAALATAANRAGWIGGGVTMVPGEGGETAMDLAKDPVAMQNTTPWQRAGLVGTRGLVNAALEEIVPQTLVVPHLLGKAVRIAPGLRAGLRNTALLAGEGAVGEYGTEFAQDLTGQYAQNVAHPGTGYNFQQAHEAGLSGAATGIFMGGAGGAAQAIHSNIGEGVDAVRSRMSKMPTLDDLMGHVLGALNDPEGAGKAMAGATLDGLAKAAEAAGVFKNYAAKGIETGSDYLSKLYDNTTTFIGKNVKDPALRDDFYKRAAQIKTMTMPEWELLTRDLSKVSGKQFLENVGAAMVVGGRRAVEGIKTVASYAADVSKGVYDEVSKRLGDRAASISGPDAADRASVMSRLYAVSPGLRSKFGALSDADQNHIANVLHLGMNDAQFFASALPEEGDTTMKSVVRKRGEAVGDPTGKEVTAMSDPQRTAMMEAWKKETGTDLLSVLSAMRSGRNEAQQEAFERGEAVAALHKYGVNPKLHDDLITSVKAASSFKGMDQGEKRNLLDAAGGNEIKALQLYVALKRAGQGVSDQEAEATQPWPKSNAETIGEALQTGTVTDEGAATGARTVSDKDVRGPPDRTEEGDAVDQEADPRSPFDHEVFKRAMIQQRYDKYTDTKIPVTLRATNANVTAEQLHQLFGERTGTNSWTKPTTKAKVTKDGGLMTAINPKSLTSVIGEKDYRDRFAPHMVSFDERPGASKSEVRGERLMSVLAHLGSVGMHLDPQLFGLPKDHPLVHVKADMNLNALPDSLIIDQSKGGTNKLTWADVSGKTRLQQSLRNQLKRLDGLKGNYAGVMTKMFDNAKNARSKTTAVDKRISNVVYHRAIKAKEIRDNAIIAKAKAKGEKLTPAELKQVNSKPTESDLDAELELYHKEIPIIAKIQRVEARMHDIQRTAIEAYRNKDISKDDLENLIAYYAGDKGTSLSDAMKTSSLFHAAVINRTKYNTLRMARELYTSMRDVDEGNQGFEETQAGGGGDESRKGTIFNEWLEHKYSAAQIAQKFSEGTQEIARKAGAVQKKEKQPQITQTSAPVETYPAGMSKETLAAQAAEAARRAKYAQGKIYEDPVHQTISKIKRAFDAHGHTFVIVTTPTSKSKYRVVEAETGTSLGKAYEGTSLSKTMAKAQEYLNSLSKEAVDAIVVPKVEETAPAPAPKTEPKTEPEHPEKDTTVGARTTLGTETLKIFAKQHLERLEKALLKRKNELLAFRKTAPEAAHADIDRLVESLKVGDNYKTSVLNDLVNRNFSPKQIAERTNDLLNSFDEYLEKLYAKYGPKEEAPKAEAAEAQGENIASKFSGRNTSPLAQALTNVTYGNYQINDVPGLTKPTDPKHKLSAEGWYQANKTGNLESRMALMQKIIEAKLRQYPELVKQITEKGGRAWLEASRHVVTGNKLWEGQGMESNFLKVLANAYDAVLAAPKKETTGRPSEVELDHAEKALAGAVHDFLNKAMAIANDIPKGKYRDEIFDRIKNAGLTLRSKITGKRDELAEELQKQSLDEMLGKLNKQLETLLTEFKKRADNVRAVMKQERLKEIESTPSLNKMTFDTGTEYSHTKLNALLQSWIKKYMPGTSIKLHIYEHQKGDAAGYMYFSRPDTLHISGHFANHIEAFSALSHEFGHLLQAHIFDKAPQAVQDKLRAAWKADKEALEAGTMTSGEAMKRFGNAYFAVDEAKHDKNWEEKESGLATIAKAAAAGKTLTPTQKKRLEYLTNFEEWFANQFSRMATTNLDTADITDEEKTFWGQLIDVMKQFFNDVVKKLTPGTEFEQWAKSLVAPQQTKDEEPPPMDDQHGPPLDESFVPPDPPGPTDNNKPPPPPGPPPVPPGGGFPNDSAKQRFLAIVHSMMGDKKVRVLFDQALKDGVTGEFFTKRQELDKLYVQRNSLVESRKGADKKRADKLTDMIKALDAKEKEILADQAVQGFIYVAVGTEKKDGLAEHETFHAAFHMFFSEEERRILGQAFTQGLAGRRLREIFKDDPLIMSRISGDDVRAEEAAAYAFQIWAQDPSQFQLGPKVNNMFQRFINFIRKLVGSLTLEEKAEMIMSSLKTGRRFEQNISPVQKILDKDTAWTERAQKLAQDVGGLLKSGYDMLLSPARERLISTDNPELTKIAKLVHEATGEEGNEGGMIQRSRKVYKAQYNELGKIFTGLNEAQLKELQQHMVLGSPTPDAEVAKRAEQLHKWYKDMYIYQVKKGVALNFAGIKEDYYPLTWDPEKVLKNKQAFIDMLEKPEYAKHMLSLKKTPHELYNSITSYIDRGEDLVNVMGVNKEPLSEASKARTLWFLDKNDRVPFMEDDPIHTSVRYMKQAIRQAEYVDSFGMGSTKLNDMIDTARDTYGATADQLALVHDYIDGAIGNKEVGMPRELKDLYGAMTVYQNFRLLPFSLFSSLIDPLGVAIRSGSATDAWETFSYSIKGLFNEWKKDYPRDFWAKYAEDMGIIEHSGTTISAHNQFDGITLRGVTKDLNDKLFKYNLLNGWMRNNTIMATKAGQRFIYRAAEGDMGKHSERFLTELGLTKDDVHYDAQQKRLLLYADELEAAGVGKAEAAALETKLSNAVEKFVRQSMLNPSSAELPNWMSNPYMAPIAHLKQFVFSFDAVIVHRIMHELEHGNFKPAALAAAYVPGMIAADFLKDMIAGFGDEPPYKKGWGFFDYFNDGVQRSGLMGAGQFFSSATEDVMRGGGGYESFAGPSLQQLQQALKAFSSGNSTSIKDFMIKSMPLMPLYKQHLINGGGGGTGQSGGGGAGGLVGMSDDLVIAAARAA